MNKRYLHAISGELEGAIFSLESRNVIGRSGDADIQLLGENVSRKHVCLIERDDGQMVLFNLSARKKIIFNNEPVDRAILKPGDQFIIGNTCFEYNEGTHEYEEHLQMKVLSGRTKDETVHSLMVPEGDRQAMKAELERLNAPSMQNTKSANSATDATHRNPQAGAETACNDPLHDQAAKNNWSFCPVCGKPPRAVSQ